mmetsp:Transcript_45321/g.135232  ORF Transcript_45321/g.135232 Transcript_45321/m.135232 type:complete len:223 (+) Transcript_45321:624-1292(+)
MLRARERRAAAADRRRAASRRLPAGRQRRVAAGQRRRRHSERVLPARRPRRCARGRMPAVPAAPASGAAAHGRGARRRRGAQPVGGRGIHPAYPEVCRYPVARGASRAPRCNCRRRGGGRSAECFARAAEPAAHLPAGRSPVAGKAAVVPGRPRSGVCRRRAAQYHGAGPGRWGLRAAGHAPRTRPRHVTHPGGGHAARRCVGEAPRGGVTRAAALGTPQVA